MICSSHAIDYHYSSPSFRSLLARTKYHHLFVLQRAEFSLDCRNDMKYCMFYIFFLNIFECILDNNTTVTKITRDSGLHFSGQHFTDRNWALAFTISPLIQRIVPFESVIPLLIISLLSGYLKNRETATVNMI